MSEIPDTYNEVSITDGTSAVSTGSRIMEFVAKNGDTFTVFERLRDGYIGRLIATDGTKSFFEMILVNIAAEIPWPGDGEAEAAELAVTP